MATYTDTVIRVQPPIVAFIEVSQCDSCGALVLDQRKHDLHHERMDQTAQTAHKAERASWMCNPIGGEGLA
jgi:hypothetical protein